jgi:hypothetical protein
VGFFLRLSLPSATGLLAVVTIGGVAALYALHLRTYSLIALVPVLVVAVIYLRAYSQRPLAVRPAPPPAPPPAAAPAAGADPAPSGTPGAAGVAEPSSPPEPIDESEPFDDPVEEADRLSVKEPPPAP